MKYLYNTILLYVFGTIDFNRVANAQFDLPLANVTASHNHVFDSLRINIMFYRFNNPQCRACVISHCA